MCKLKSAIILKDKIFMPDYDSHSDMLRELGIEDNYIGASKTFVRAELSPEDNDIFSDINTWEFNVDQDITPDWFNEDEYKPLMVEKVKEWAKERIYIDVGGLELRAGVNYYIKNCKNVTACDNSTVKAWGNSTVKAWDNSTVKAWGNSTVIKAEYSRFRKSNLVLSENSTFKDCATKTIYQSGDWKLVAVKGGKK